jgi:hypothetical protein
MNCSGWTKPAMNADLRPAAGHPHTATALIRAGSALFAVAAAGRREEA